MAHISNEIIEKVKLLLAKLSKNGIHIEKAMIFGSYIKGSAEKFSDIDIALVSSDFTGNRFFDRKMINPFIIKVDSRIEPHPFKSEDFTKDDPFVVEILKNCLEVSVKQSMDDPLLQLAGMFESDVTDISQNHDKYIGD